MFVLLCVRLSFLCVCVCERALVNWPVVLGKADAWSEWVISYMRSVLLEVGILSLSFSLSFFYLSVFPTARFKKGNQYSVALSLFSALLFFFRPTFSAYLHHLWASQITAQIGCSTFLSPFIEIGLDEGWPGALSDFQELIKQKIIGEAFSQKHTFSKTQRHVDLEAFAMKTLSKKPLL